MRSLILAVLLFGFFERLEGQAEPDTVKLRNDCRLATQVLTTGRPAPHLEWASWFIRRCPDAGSVIARSVRLHRDTHDTVFLKAVTGRGTEIRDRAIYEAGLEVFSADAAAPEARVFAARLLAWLFLPGADLRYRDMVPPDGTPSMCFVRRPPIDLEIIRGELLPPGWPDVVRAAAKRVREDSSQPPIVRQAAACFIYIEPSPIMIRMEIADRA
jgi:hypothetical protein